MQLKTVTITKTPTQKYCASLLFDTEQATPEVVPRVKVTGVDLGLKDFCITHDGVKTSKYANPSHLKKHEKIFSISIACNIPNFNCSKC